MTKRLLPLLAVAALFAVATPAQASTVPAADFGAGSRLGLGFAGLSYDHAFGDTLVGAALNSDGMPTGSSRFKLGVRGLHRFLSLNGVKVGAIAGLQYDPGVPGQRAYLVPDLGLSFAYTFPGEVPVSLKVNLTLTVDQYTSVDPLNPVPRGNVLQRLTFGPTSMFGGEVQLNEHLALTLGGGTLAGVRLNY